MTQDFLQAENVTTVQEEVFSECVSECMRGTSYSGNTNPPSGPSQHLLDATSSERQSWLAEEQPGYPFSQGLWSIVVDVFPQNFLNN